MPADECFPKHHRLLKRREFLQVQGDGVKVAAEPLLALALRNGTARTRLGITVSSKVGGATIRTRLRRQLRELFRKKKENLPQGLDLVLIARNSAAKAPFQELEKAFDKVAAQLRGRFR